MKGPPLPPPRFTDLLDALRSVARTSLALTFVDAREKDEVIPWAELYLRARRVAGALREIGIQRGERVAIISSTSPSFVEAFFGAQLAGAVPVPLYPPLRLGRLEEYHRSTVRMLRRVGASILLTEAKVALLLGEVTAAGRLRHGVRVISQLRASGSATLDQPADPSAIALVQFSSGSTVAPKPVALSHANLLSQCRALEGLMPDLAGTGQLGVSWLPLYHDMGLIGCLLGSLYYPGPLVLIPPELFLARPAIWLRTISRHRATISAAPNFAFGLCLRRVADADLEGVDLSSWRYALNGAEPVSPALMKRFSQRFAHVGLDPSALMPVYGLSEASLAVTFSARGRVRASGVDPRHLAERGEVRPGGRQVASVGVPVPGAEVEVRSAHGELLADGQVGKIYVRGASVMQGYFEDPPATARAMADGWLDTGDLGFWWEGELHVCGRAKDVVVIRGANHSPQEFEECLDGMDGVRPGCAVAVGHCCIEDEGESLVVFAERTEPAPADLEERIRAAVLARTGVRPQAVVLLAPGTLPRTSSGKMRRGEALRRWVSGELHPPRKVTRLGILAKMARSAVSFARSGG